MYMTPIFYPDSIIPEKFLFVIHLNPLYYYLDIFRGALYLDVPSISAKLLYGFLFSLASLTVGWFFYSINKDKIIYHL
jgi:ABC-type polysaccharide/polyol phosphate export permease